MTSGIQDKTRGAAPGRRIASGWAACVAALLCLVFLSAPAYARPRVWAQARRAAPARQAAAKPPAGRAAEPQRGNNAGRPIGNPGVARPGGNAPGNSGQPLSPAGNRVEKLHRERIGGFALPDDLAEGQWRWLDDADLAMLRHC